MPAKVMGRPPCPLNIVREAWLMRFVIAPRRRIGRDFPASLLEQLARCKSDEARRLILGISR